MYIAMVYLKLVNLLIVEKQIMLPAALLDIESEICYKNILFAKKMPTLSILSNTFSYRHITAVQVQNPSHLLWLSLLQN